jgi:hypothetical protein
MSRSESAVASAFHDLLTIGFSYFGVSTPLFSREDLRMDHLRENFHAVHQTQSAPVEVGRPVCEIYFPSLNRGQLGPFRSTSEDR